MVFNSMQYLLFLPVVFLVYYLLPAKARNVWLLLTSYYFYMCFNVRYAWFILGVTVFSYAGAMLIDRKRQLGKVILIAVVILEILVLVYFKYINFIIGNINGVLTMMNSGRSYSALDMILPIGISYYIFQSVGYVVDVYKQQVKPEKNFIEYALFISFFPQLVSGPIERSKSLLPQLKQLKNMEAENIRIGLVYILIGVWQKVLIADNIAPIVNEIYENYQGYFGIQIMLATMLFYIQLYCDFGGYTNIAMGSARLFGITLLENFDSPFLAVNITDFWRRWHKSLTSWLRDYIYIPLGGNRKGKLRKYINTLFVFMVSGIWHGAAWKYIFWGLLNGGCIVAEDALKRLCKVKREISENRKWGNRWGKRMVTFAVTSFLWLFFRAASLREAVDMVFHSITHIGLWKFIQENMRGNFLIADRQMAFVLAVSILFILIVAVLRERGNKPVLILLEQQWAVRWLVYIIITVMIIFYGAYGGGYEQTQFIYFQF